jgi:beta-galactosidase/beta-glucuronidase
MKKIVVIALSLLLASCAPKTSWAPAGDRIMTRWAQEVSPAKVHQEYPRPQMVRDKWKSLNGLWDYAVTPCQAEEMPEAEGQILVPFCIESALSGVGRRVSAQEALWYKTTFKVPGGWKERVLLHFDAVDWKAEVWLNGRPLGIHTGGYTAFSFDITDYLAEGLQTLVLKVQDGTDNDTQPRGKQVSNPGGIWYTPVTGIWQSVWMEPVPLTYIKDYKAVADIDASTITVTADTDGGDMVCVTLLEGGEGYSTETGKPGRKVAYISGEPGKEIVLNVPDQKLWSPEHPYLYALDIEVLRNGKVKDRVHGYTAMRKSSLAYDFAGYKRLGLNNKAYFQYGPLDQGWWPDGLYTAPTDDALRYDIEKTKEWGWNMIRKHIKVEPARWYWYCDRIGIAVWQDMPSIAGNIDVHTTTGYPQWGQFAYETGYDYPLPDDVKANYYKEWGEIMHQLQNYPCILVWVPFNEGWAQFDTEKVVEFTREQDPTRLINSASGGNSYHVGDILDSHNYPAPVMKFRSHGSQIDVLGEYGGIGLAVEGHLWNAQGRNWGYQGLCKDGKEVLDKYEAYASQFVDQIISGVAAGIYTQTTDVESELNGIMTYDRAVVKVDEKRFREINLEVRSVL